MADMAAFGVGGPILSFRMYIMLVIRGSISQHLRLYIHTSTWILLDVSERDMMTYCGTISHTALEHVRTVE